MIKEKLYKHREEQDAKHRAEHVASGKWNASMLGGCNRKHFLKRKGLKPSNLPTMEGLGKMRMGILHEYALIKEMRDSGMKIDWEQEEVDYKDVFGKMDCRIADEDMPVEIKSQQSKSFWYGKKQGTMLKHSHKFQLGLYLLAKKKKKGIVAYISKDDNCIEEVVVYLSEDLKKALEAKIASLNGYWERETVPPAEPDEKWECSDKWCPYFNTCEKLGKRAVSIKAKKEVTNGR